MKSREILDQVIDLIANDVREIAQGGDGMDADVALKLTRYSAALLAMTKDLDAQDDKGRKSVEKLSTDELLARARTALPDLFKNAEKD